MTTEDAIRYDHWDDTLTFYELRWWDSVFYPFPRVALWFHRHFGRIAP